MMISHESTTDSMSDIFSMMVIRIFRRAKQQEPISVPLSECELAVNIIQLFYHSHYLHLR